MMSATKKSKRDADPPPLAVCRYCAGTGRTPPPAPQPTPARRGAALRLIPNGREVASALGTATVPPTLLADDFSNLDPKSGRVVHTVSRWDEARAANECHGAHCMVVPPGADVTQFTFPDSLITRRPAGPQLVAFVDRGADREKVETLGRGLIECGFSFVVVRGSVVTGAVEFHAEQG